MGSGYGDDRGTDRAKREYKIKLGLQNAPVMAEQYPCSIWAAIHRCMKCWKTSRPVRCSQLRRFAGGQGSGALHSWKQLWQRLSCCCVLYAGATGSGMYAFLRREFGEENGRGIEYEGRRYAVWFMKDGIHLAQGNSVRTGYERTTVSWKRASANFRAAGSRDVLSAAELEQAPDKVLWEMADALLMTARDLSEEGRALGLFPRTRAIHDQRKDYPELDTDMVAFAKSEDGLAILDAEYHAF